MDDAILKKIIKSYSQKWKFLLSEKEVEKILFTLKKIDDKKERPLFALILTDIFMEKNETKQDTMEEILIEVLNKEEKRLKNNVQNYFRKTNKVNKIVSICKLFLLAGLLLREKANEETIKSVFWENLEAPASS